MMMMEANVILKCQIFSEDRCIKRHGSARLWRPVITKPGHIGRAAAAHTGGVCRDEIRGNQVEEEGGGKTGLHRAGRGYKKGHLRVI